MDEGTQKEVIQPTTHEGRKQVALNFINGRFRSRVQITSFKPLQSYLNEENKQLHPYDQTFMSEEQVSSYFQRIIAVATGAKLDATMTSESAFDRLFECITVLLPTTEYKESILREPSWEKSMEDKINRLVGELDEWSPSDKEKPIEQLSSELSGMSVSVDSVLAAIESLKTKLETRDQKITTILIRIEKFLKTYETTLERAKSEQEAWGKKLGEVDKKGKH